MTIITLYALFASDVMYLTCPKSADEIFYGITTAVFSMFLIEIVLSCLAIDGYLFGFYFWLDLIATLSLISDIGWIWKSIFTETTIEDFLNTGTGTSGGGNSKTAETGTTIGRVLRVI
jgi:hypothetical protein